MNSCQFVGHVLENAEAGKTKSGLDFAKFQVNIPAGKEKSYVATVNVWGDMAVAFSSKLQKGTKVHVVCSYTPSTYNYQGRESTSHRFTAKDITILSEEKSKSLEETLDLPF